MAARELVENRLLANALIQFIPTPKVLEIKSAPTLNRQVIARDTVPANGFTR